MIFDKPLKLARGKDERPSGHYQDLLTATNLVFSDHQSDQVMTYQSGVPQAFSRSKLARLIGINM